MNKKFLGAFLTATALSISAGALAGQPQDHDVHDCRNRQCQDTTPPANPGNGGQGGQGGQGGSSHNNVNNAFNGSVEGTVSGVNTGTFNNDFSGSVTGTNNGSFDNQNSFEGSVTGVNSAETGPIANDSSANAVGKGGTSRVEITDNSSVTYKEAKQVGVAPSMFLQPTGDCGEGKSFSIGFIGGAFGGGETTQGKVCLSQKAAQAIINAGLVKGDDGMIAGGLRSLANIHFEIDAALETVGANMLECANAPKPASVILMAQKTPHCKMK